MFMVQLRSELQDDLDKCYHVEWFCRKKWKSIYKWYQTVLWFSVRCSLHARVHLLRLAENNSRDKEETRTLDSGDVLLIDTANVALTRASGEVSQFHATITIKCLWSDWPIVAKCNQCVNGCVFCSCIRVWNRHYDEPTTISTTFVLSIVLCTQLTLPLRTSILCTLRVNNVAVISWLYTTTMLISGT